jgi:hypothetical protein
MREGDHQGRGHKSDEGSVAVSLATHIFLQFPFVSTIRVLNVALHVTSWQSMARELLLFGVIENSSWFWLNIKLG